MLFILFSLYFISFFFIRGDESAQKITVFILYRIATSIHPFTENVCVCLCLALQLKIYYSFLFYVYIHIYLYDGKSGEKRGEKKEIFFKSTKFL
jgi:hypothetical protein